VRKPDRHGQVVPQLREVGVEGERAPVRRERIGVPAGDLQRVAVLEMREGLARRQLHELFAKHQGIGMRAARQQRSRERAQGPDG
jgi:hypothetical protein